MANHYQALTESFCEYADSRGGFPPNRIVMSWMKRDKECGTYAGGTYSAIRKGHFVKQKYVHSFIRLLVTQSNRVELRQARIALLDYLARYGVTQLEERLIPIVLSRVATPPMPEPDDPRGMVDYLARPWHTIAELSELGRGHRYVSGCTPEDLPDMVKWMYLAVGRDRAPDGPTLSESQAIQFAGSFMRITDKAYEACAREWHNDNPWTVIHAVYRKTLVGMSIVLPLRPDVYDELREGHRTGYQCTPSDFHVPSQHIWLEAVAENPSALADSGLKPTLALKHTLTFQIAALARCNRFSSRSTLHLLSFAGTEKNEGRQKKAGFAATGTQTRSLQLKLMERQIQVGTLGSADFVENAALTFLGHRLPSAPPLLKRH